MVLQDGRDDFCHPDNRGGEAAHNISPRSRSVEPGNEKGLKDFVSEGKEEEQHRAPLYSVCSVFQTTSRQHIR